MAELKTHPLWSKHSISIQGIVLRITHKLTRQNLTTFMYVAFGFYTSVKGLHFRQSEGQRGNLEPQTHAGRGVDEPQSAQHVLTPLLSTVFLEVGILRAGGVGRLWHLCDLRPMTGDA